jgi:hypothetical protein
MGSSEKEIKKERERERVKRACEENKNMFERDLKEKEGL